MKVYWQTVDSAVVKKRLFVRFRKKVDDGYHRRRRGTYFKPIAHHHLHF